MRGTLIFLPLLLAGCATPSARIADGLTRYGLDRTRANCVGDHLQARLSLGQLRQLGRAARTYGGDGTPRPLDAADLMRAAARIDDPVIPIEVGRAGLACGVGADLLR